MTRINGRKPLPLPSSLLQGLRSAGWKPIVNADEKGNPKEPGQVVWAHLAAAGLRVKLVASNMPGEPFVLATYTGHPEPVRINVDELLAILAALVASQLNPVQPSRRSI